LVRGGCGAYEGLEGSVIHLITCMDIDSAPDLAVQISALTCGSALPHQSSSALILASIRKDGIVQDWLRSVS
jgi:hypothetical protein